MEREFLIKFLKFGIVGCIGLVIDFGVTYLLKEVLKVNRYVSNSIGFSLAVTNNYILNRVWTFASTEQDILGEFSKFLIIACSGLIINNIIIYLLHSRFKMNFYVSKVIAIGIVVIWNFMNNYNYTFAN